MRERAPFTAAVLLSASALTSCGSEAAPPAPFSMPEITSMNVACMNVEGFEPYTSESCAAVQQDVEAGLQLVSDLTNGKIPLPKLSYKVHPDVIAIEDAKDVRCTNFRAENLNPAPLQDMIMTIAKTAMQQETNIDFSDEGLFIAVNAPTEICRKPQPLGPSQTPPAATEQCPPLSTSKRPAFEGGRALLELKKPVIFSFTEPHERKREAREVAHERLHLGRGNFQLGHEYAICNREGATIPSFIGQRSSSLDIDSTSQGLSIMSATGNGSYLSMPNQLFMGTIEPHRVESITRSKNLTFHDTTGDGLAVAQLPISNKTVKNLIATRVAHQNLGPNDYTFYLAKIPDRAEMGIYAAPSVNKPQNEVPATFLIKRMGRGEQLIVDGDLEARVLEATDQSVTVDLRV